MGKAEDWGIKAIAFDIDGTLYPKWQMDIRLAAASVLHLPFAMCYNAMRRRIRREDGLAEMPAGSLEELQRRECLMLYGSEDSLHAFIDKEQRVFRKPWERLFSSIKPFPGMHEFMEEASSGYDLAVLSDFPIGVKLKALGVEEYFSYIASAEDSGHLKPSPVPFRVMLDALGLEPHQVLYVGDSESKDIAGARNAGLRSALISTSRRKVYSIADTVFSSWDGFRREML